jgi:large subunit ribosomal protein L23
MNNYRDIIKAPIITEKSANLTQNNNTVVLSVDPKANKTQIKQAVEKVFNVKVLSVNTVNATTKKKRVGKYVGRTNQVKKAIVKLAEGSSIELN